jgi:hypothetical protein
MKKMCSNAPTTSLFLHCIEKSTFNHKWWHFQAHSVVLWFVRYMMSEQMVFQLSFYSWVSFIRIILAQTFLMCYQSCKICLTVSLSIVTISAIIWVLQTLTFLNNFTDFVSFLLFSDVEGHPRCSSFSASSRLSKRPLCHSKTCIHDIALLSYIPLKTGNILSFFNLARNFRLMHSLIFILVTNLAEHLDTVTLKQSSETNQLK